MKRNILLVDDDENILEGYKRILRNNYSITTANTVVSALETLKSNPDIAVIVSDFRMPQMDGVTFLRNVKSISPNTVRILLTGYADADTAINAVNESNIFRLLTKPCKPDRLQVSLNDAIKQHELIIAEKEILELTLKGSIKVLVDVLSIVNPSAFKLSNQMVTLAKRIALHLGIEKGWQMEMAALLSQIGCVAIPNEIFRKKMTGAELLPDEEALFNSHPSVGANLIKNIPRLEGVAEIILHQLKNESEEAEVPMESKILHVLNDYFLYASILDSREEAFQAIKKNGALYNKEVLFSLDAEIAGIYAGLQIIEIKFIDLKVGHVLAGDVQDSFGNILITRGTEISELLKIRLDNFNKIRPIIEPVMIFEV